GHGRGATRLPAKLFDQYMDRAEFLAHDPPDQVRQGLRSREPARGLLGNRIGNRRSPRWVAHDRLLPSETEVLLDELSSRTCASSTLKPRRFSWTSGPLLERTTGFEPAT